MNASNSYSSTTKKNDLDVAQLFGVVTAIEEMLLRSWWSLRTGK